MSVSRQPAMWKAFCLWCLCACYPRAMLEDGWRLHRGRQIPWNLFSPKAPFHATVVANHDLPRMLSPATGEAGETLGPVGVLGLEKDRPRCGIQACRLRLQPFCLFHLWDPFELDGTGFPALSAHEHVHP
eukprot:s2798_g5.t1